jgi:hypothetical protein
MPSDPLPRAARFVLRTASLLPINLALVGR